MIGVLIGLVALMLILVGIYLLITGLVKGFDIMKLVFGLILIGIGLFLVVGFIGIPTAEIIFYSLG